MGLKEIEATAAALQVSSDPMDQEAAKGFIWFMERVRAGAPRVVRGGGGTAGTVRLRMLEVG